MPSISIDVPNLEQSGPLMEIQIAPSSPVVEFLRSNDDEVPTPIRCAAMIDTGASSTVIREGIAQQLNLNPRGSVNIATPSCAQYPCNTYDITMLFPATKVAIQIVTVVEAPLSGQNIDCLIGRDILKRSILIYEGYSNRFILSF